MITIHEAQSLFPFLLNNNYTEVASTPFSRDSTLFGGGTLESTRDDDLLLMRDTPPRDDALPLIDYRFINNSRANSKPKSPRRTREKSGKKSKTKVESPVDEIRSKVYIRDRKDKKIYLLEFTAVDVKLIPAYLRHRTFEENVNDKCNQPHCHSSYINFYNNTSQKFNQLKKTYEINKLSPNDVVSVMSSRKPLFPRPIVASPTRKRVSKISDRQSNLKLSVIYLNFEGKRFRILPGFFDLYGSETIDLDNEERRKKLLKSLNMELPADLKNKASLVVKHKGDVLKFQFAMDEIVYSKLKVTTSIGVLAKDDLVYIKEFSPITNRKVYLGVPKTIYDYRDPMINIKRKNMSMKLNKVVPIWKEDQRRKRIKEYNQCRKKSVYEDITDLKIGSKMYYEGFGCLNKVKGGTLSCETNDEDYENWVISNQKCELPTVEDESEKFESTFCGDVPDWDLVIYSK